MATSILSKAEYNALLRDILKLNNKADALSSEAKVGAYWAIGKRIKGVRASEKAGYHNSVIRDLAADTGLAIRTLHQSLKFYEEYRKAPREEGLSWSHYRVLLLLPTKKERDFYIDKVRAEGWSSRQLAAAVSAGLHQGGSSALSSVARPTDAEYLFQTTVLDVIDGDTLDLDCDLGFGVSRKLRVRFAVIDCPPIETAKGRAARDFVATQLMSARTLVVKTQKTDIYGRYIVHVFYSSSAVSITSCFEHGRHLNDLLVKKKHAVVIG